MCDVFFLELWSCLDAELDNLPPLPSRNTSTNEPVPAMEEPVSSTGDASFNHFFRFQAKFSPTDAFLFSLLSCGGVCNVFKGMV